MREPTQGNQVPHTTYTWLIANQGIAANANYTPAAIALPGAVTTNSQVLVSARSALPRTAGGAAPSVEGYVNAANQVTLVISNTGANAVVATAADIVFDIMLLPIIP